MKRHTEKDERILAEKRKIGSDAFQILWIGLFISVLIQQYAFKASIAQYVVEIVFVIAMSIYIIARNIMVGNDMFPSKKKNSHKIVIINSIVCGLTITIVNTVQNYLQYGQTIKGSVVGHIVLVAGISFVFATAASFALLQFFYYTNKKRQAKLEETLQEKEENI